MRHHATLALALLGTIAAMPALAHDGPHGAGPRMQSHWGGPFGVWYGGWNGGWNGGGWQEPTVIEYTPPAAEVPGPQPQNREEWLRECRHRLGDNGVGGAVIGGVIGGVAGNVIAGHGDKVLGTVAGAAVGAVAGAAIDKAEDAPRNRDRCEAMLEGWDQGGGYPAGYGYGYGYGYGVPMMLVPVTMIAGAPQAARGPCKETVVTEEIITEVPRRSRLIPRRVSDKRVKLVPDKRVSQ